MSSYITYILSHALSMSGCIYIDQQMSVKPCLVRLLPVWFRLLWPDRYEIKPRHSSGNGSLQELI